MLPTRRALLGTIAPLALAGCVGTDGDDADGTPGVADSPTRTKSPTDSPTPTPTRSPTDSPTDSPTPRTGAAPTVRVRSHSGLGEILVGPGEMTLYILTSDSPGESVCYGGCAEAWPPLTVEDGREPSAGEGVTGDLAVAERDDGSLQVTIDGMPLYYWARDEEPGDATGQEVGNVWFVVRPDASVVKPTVSVREHPELGDILTDADGMTLYEFEKDEGSESVCYGGCAEAWPPLTVDSPDALVDSVRSEVDLGTTARDDGELQVTADGTPLYYFASDDEPGDARGQGANDVWFVLRPDGSPVVPTPTPSPTPTSTPSPTPPDDDDGDGGDEGY